MRGKDKVALELEVEMVKELVAGGNEFGPEQLRLIHSYCMKIYYLGYRNGLREDVGID